MCKEKKCFEFRGFRFVLRVMGFTGRTVGSVGSLGWHCSPNMVINVKPH